MSSKQLKSSGPSAATIGAHAAEPSLPWVEKYRPNSLNELIAQDDIVSTINKLMDVGRLPHLLFYGPPGTGKTSTILACAKRLYGSNMHVMTLELNASDDRGIAVVRDQIKSFAGTRLFNKGVKLVILDEADAMTSDAQFALRRVIERYTKNARFCLICNYASKIIPALQSRCTRFRFAPLKKHLIDERIRYIADTEGLNYTEEGIKAVIRLGNGDMRRVLNILQATSMAFPEITDDAVYACTGNPKPSEINAIARSLLNDTFSNSFSLICNMQLNGLALTDILFDVSKLVTGMKLPSDVLAYLLEQLGDIEHRLVFGTNESLQLASLVSAFSIAREKLSQYAPKTA